jgi:cytochrome P450
VIGTFQRFRQDPLRFLETRVGQADETPLVRFRFGREEVYLANGVETVNAVLVTHARSFAHEPVWRPRWLLPPRVTPRAGLASTEYDQHNARRKALQPAFGQEHGHRLAGIVATAADDLCACWSTREKVALDDECGRTALQIVYAALFDEAPPEGVSADLALFVSSLRHVGPRRARQIVSRSSWRAGSAFLRLQETIRQTHPDAGTESTPPSLGTLLRTIQSDHPGLDSDALVILAAGEATLRPVLEWTLLQLAFRPELQEEIAQEADEVLGDRDRFDLDDLGRLPLMRSVALETLRLYPPNWFVGRRALERVELDAGAIARHALVLVSPYLLQRDRRYFDEPEQFHPARFGAASEFRHDEAAFLPFGAGSRRCIGERIAWLSQILITTTIARRFRLNPAEGGYPSPVAEITLRPASGSSVRIEKRETGGMPMTAAAVVAQERVGA